MELGQKSEQVAEEVFDYYGPLDSKGHRQCEVCCNTFAIWHCLDEELYLCGKCNTRMHPWTNPKRLAHKRIPVDPNIGEVQASHGVLHLVLWESYRLTLVPTMVGLFKWFEIGEEYCDGQPPGVCTPCVVSFKVVLG